MKFENYMILEFPSRSSNEAFARSAVACFAAQLDPTLEELGDIKTAVSEAVTKGISIASFTAPSGLTGMNPATSVGLPWRPCPARKFSPAGGRKIRRCSPWSGTPTTAGFIGPRTTGSTPTAERLSICTMTFIRMTLKIG